MRTLLTFLTALILLPLSARAVKISYAYDAAGRMTAVNYDGASRTAYGYDKNGSLLARVSTATPALTPPPHLAGTYTGLITNLTPNAGNTGIISLKLLGNGTFSGKFTVQGVSIPITGKFLADGSLEGLHVIIDRKAPLTDFLLSLSLDVQSGVPSISGTVTGEFETVTFNSSFAMQPDYFGAGGLLMAAGFAGKYTLLLSPQNTAGIPQGTGYATVVVSSKGAVTMVGKLANNIAITQGVQILGANIWPVYVPLHSNKGYIAGNLRFFAPGNIALNGSLDWLKPGTSGLVHPAAFITELDAFGSRYTPPLAGQRVLDFAATTPNAVFIATDGDLSPSPLTRDITLDASNKFTAPVDAVLLKLTLAAATGFVSGSFKVSPTVTRSLSGVVLQSEGMASGFFLGSTESGGFDIAPPP